MAACYCWTFKATLRVPGSHPQPPQPPLKSVPAAEDRALGADDCTLPGLQTAAPQSSPDMWAGPLQRQRLWVRPECAWSTATLLGVQSCSQLRTTMTEFCFVYISGFLLLLLAWAQRTKR